MEWGRPLTVDNPCDLFPRGTSQCLPYSYQPHQLGARHTGSHPARGEQWPARPFVSNARPIESACRVNADSHGIHGVSLPGYKRCSTAAAMHTECLRGVRDTSARERTRVGQADDSELLRWLDSGPRERYRVPAKDIKEMAGDEGGSGSSGKWMDGWMDGETVNNRKTAND